MKTNYVIPEVQVLTLGAESFLMTSGTGEGTGSDLGDPTIIGGDFDDLFNIPSLL